MRKVSKNRTDDDIISSTNGSGSLHNEEKQDSEQSVEDTEKESLSGKGNKSPNDVSDVDKTPDSSKKGKSKKSKPKKKKATKTKKVEEEEEDEDEEYEVEEVIDSKRIRGKLHYLIRWKGYSADNDTWEPENTLSCPELINKFNEEKENSTDKVATSPRNKKGLKRKSNTKTKTSPKKTKNDKWDSKGADEEAEYEVERILEVHHKKSGERDFLIHWKGWASKFDSWEPESNLNCPELIKKFMAKVDKARSSEFRSLRVAPETTNRFTLQAPSSGRRLSKRKNQRQRVRYDNAE